jgi:HTH-type transcriptional regulator / antitoxin HigA
MKPIRSTADYEAALAEVGRLWGAKAGTRDGDRCDIFATLIDAYEAEKHSMEPIEATKFNLGWSSKASRGLTWSKSSAPERGVAEMLNPKRERSIRVIRRVHERLASPRRF